MTEKPPEYVAPEVNGTLVIRIPGLTTDEITRLYQLAQAIVDEFGGEFEFSARPPRPQS